jgi:hypothetical protein
LSCFGCLDLALIQLNPNFVHPRTRIRFIGLSHIQNGKSYEQVAQYLLQSLSAVKQWVRHYKDEGMLVA